MLAVYLEVLCNILSMWLAAKANVDYNALTHAGAFLLEHMCDATAEYTWSSDIKKEPYMRHREHHSRRL